jgi:NADH-quinone oxidoreductase subunit L
MAELFWLIPLIPGGSSLLLVLFGTKLSRRWIAWQASSAVFLSFLLSIAAFVHLARLPDEGPGLSKTLLPWISSGSFSSPVAFVFDHLTAVMALVVTGVGLLIHVYSTAYMAQDRSYARYFAHLNLFTFFMLVLVMASDLVLMFVGWEGVGLCSYLLIGFWFERPTAAKAGLKAFVVNRVGDAAFIIGILFLLVQGGGSSFAAINEGAASGLLPSGLVTLVAVLLFIGATGKSAQIPLYVWLPDAMEGPTPVSALIHAATMVTAGVYMVCRLSGLYAASVPASTVVAWIGAATALFAATMALVQNDIKKVLAYSTISQIGYMFIGCGVGAYAAGMFHLVTHAFFKSLLFLAAGSVIHALAGEQDMRRTQETSPGDLSRIPCRGPGHFGRPFLVGFFLQGRHPDGRVRRRTICPLGGRTPRRRLDGVLHVPAGLSDILWRSTDDASGRS